MYIHVRDQNAAIILVVRQCSDGRHGYKHNRLRLVESLPAKEACLGMSLCARFFVRLGSSSSHGVYFFCRGWKAYFLWRTLVFLQLTNLSGDYKRCDRTCVVLPVQIVLFLFEQWWVSVCLVCTYGRSSPNWNLSCLKQ